MLQQDTGGEAPATIWEPAPEFIERTNVWRFMRRLGFADRDDFLRFSRENPERFWDEMMREMRVEWFHSYRQVLDLTNGPEWAQWFVGGRINIAHNCLDRWAETSAGAGAGPGLGTGALPGAIHGAGTGTGAGPGAGPGAGAGP